MDVEDPAVRRYLTKLVGEEGLKVVEETPEGEEVTDEEIAEISEISLNMVRRTLFRLYEARLAEYRRERDQESGWLTYLWRIDLSDIESVLDSEMQKLLENLEERLDFEENSVFYTCDKMCARLLFDDAAETGFICPICGGELNHLDNEEIVEVLEHRIEEIKAAGYG